MVLALVLAASLFSPEDSLLIKVTDPKDAENYFVGSSFLISEFEILTSAHILYIKNSLVGYNFVKVYCKGEELSVSLVAVDKNKDIALLELNKECKQPILKLAESNPEYTEKVITVGAPDGRIGLAAAGIVSGYQIDNDGHTWLLSDVGTFFGSSGGPLFSMTHKVVGLCSRILGFSQFAKEKDGSTSVITNTYSMWMPVSEIRKFLEASR